MDDVTTLYDIAVSSYSLCLGHLYDLCKFCLLYKALLTSGYELGLLSLILKSIIKSLMQKSDIGAYIRLA